jgi:hypothetical protein
MEETSVAETVEVMSVGVSVARTEERTSEVEGVSLG